jgi:hypothetical protein
LGSILILPPSPTLFSLWFLPFCFLTQTLHAHLFFPMRATCHTYCTLLDLINLTTTAKKMLRSLTLCNVPSYFLAPLSCKCSPQHPVLKHSQYLLTHGTELFLRSRQLCSHSRTSQHFMEPEGSLPCSKEPSICPYPEPYRPNPYHLLLCLQYSF